jgi:glycerate kinase
MKFVLAPDSYKGSLTAIQACDAMEEGIRRVMPDAVIIKVPMADGGEGTVQSLVDAMNGRIYQATVKNPLGEPVRARYGILQDQETAMIDRPMSLEDAMTNAKQLLTDMTERVIRLKFSSLTRTIY